VELVAATIVRALTRAHDLGARVVCIPALATGFGPLSIEDFATAVARATEQDWSPLETLKVALLREEDAEIVRDVLTRSRAGTRNCGSDARPNRGRGSIGCPPDR
jgi:O-acetyl-ADP-ribose deacetylase (regulator of RNase III)